ncbi:MAG: hypothetical protein SFU56_03600 [Capsulimonadales bacterium]|nr:hypothetical protein [Capsulimonadales bacterium]
MPDITNVNLTFQRKVRGLAPLSRFAVRDDGSLAVSVPDEMEVRTFHIVRFDARGRSQVLETYNVETLRKTEIGKDGKNFVGSSDDHCYLFREGRKSRFMTDRRASYTDIALAEEGQRFVVAFSDLLASGHALALGDVGGRLLWTKDMPFPVRRVAVDRGMNHIAIVGETGDLLILDPSRNTVLKHRQEMALTAVATNGPGRTMFAGGGGVGLIDADGQLLWFTEVPGEPVDVGLDAQGQTIAVLLRTDDASGRLILFSEGGLPIWDIDFDEARPTGLSVSADGGHLAVSLRDGTAIVYELQYGERFAALDSAQVMQEAQSARESGNWHGAVLVLKERLSAVPTDTAVCGLLAETFGAFRSFALAAAANAEAVGDFAEADGRLADMLAADPTDLEIVRCRRELRHRWSTAALTAGREAAAEENNSVAEARFLDAIAADPLNTEAREALAAIRQTAATAAIVKGTSLLRMGQFSEAIAALTEAQRRGAHGSEVTGLLRDARVGEALVAGNALYQDRQYAAALFQFKKVLRLDPDNAEARQKVSYAQNFLQDNQLNERFSRLE